MVRIVEENAKKEAICPRCWSRLEYEKDDVCKYDLEKWFMDKTLMQKDDDSVPVLRNYRLIALEKPAIICPKCHSHFDIEGESGGCNEVAEAINYDLCENFTDFLEKCNKHYQTLGPNLHIKYLEMRGIL